MTLEQVNDFLDKNYGRKDPLYPRFRVVFSDNTFEKQKMIREYSTIINGEPKVISTEDAGVQLVPKYSWIKGCYIFEVHTPTDDPAIVDQGGNYEPLKVFWDDDTKEPLPLDLDMCQLIAKALTTQVERKSPGQLKSEYQEKMDKATALEFDMFDDHIPYLIAQKRSGSGVFLDSTKVYDKSKAN